jgi:hypothetical protein
MDEDTKVTISGPDGVEHPIDFRLFLSRQRENPDGGAAVSIEASRIIDAVQAKRDCSAPVYAVMAMIERAAYAVTAAGWYRGRVAALLLDAGDLSPDLTVEQLADIGIQIGDVTTELNASLRSLRKSIESAIRGRIADAKQAAK